MEPDRPRVPPHDRSRSNRTVQAQPKRDDAISNTTLHIRPHRRYRRPARVPPNASRRSARILTARLGCMAVTLCERMPLVSIRVERVDGWCLWSIDKSWAGMPATVMDRLA